MRILSPYLVLCLLVPQPRGAMAQVQASAADDVAHGYHAFGFSELSVIADVRLFAFDRYEESLVRARALQSAIGGFLDRPSPAGLDLLRAKWIAAREPYTETEVLRFIVPRVAEWEIRVNAWPLDEGLIDYTENSELSSSADSPYSRANIIANPSPVINGRRIDAREITPRLLADVLHELDGIESNVATGYHAIEFLLWGQDLNGTGPGSGDRPWTDYSLEQCSLELEAAAESHQSAIDADDSVTGQYDRQWVGTVGRTHGTRSGWTATNPAGELAVGDGFTIGNL